MSNNFELTLFLIVNYIPYFLLTLLPFKTAFRFSKKKTAVLFFSFLVAVAVTFFVGYNLKSPYTVLSGILITLLNISCLFICVKSHWGQILFVFFTVKNISSFVLVVAKCLEKQIFPDTVAVPYALAGTFCMLVIMVPLLPIVVRIADMYFSESAANIKNPSVWKFLWFIPVFFYGIWIYIFYCSPNASAFTLATTPLSAVFMLFFLFGQFFVYICLLKLVDRSNNCALLEDENKRLAMQYDQYKCMQEQISEISRAKHDLRHRLITICGYADNENYGELKEYLHQYINSFPNDKISYCGNTVLNMLLVYYAQKSKERNTAFNVNLNIPSTLVLSDGDITVLFGNLLENALEACIDISDRNKRFISFNGQLLHNQLVFVVENSFENEYIPKKSGAIRSTKHKGDGIGTASVKNIINKYNGNLEITTKETVFSVAMIIPMD